MMLTQMYIRPDQLVRLNESGCELKKDGKGTTDGEPLWLVSFPEVNRILQEPQVENGRLLKMGKALLQRSKITNKKRVVEGFPWILHWSPARGELHGKIQYLRARI